MEERRFWFDELAFIMWLRRFRSSFAFSGRELFALSLARFLQYRGLFGAQPAEAFSTLVHVEHVIKHQAEVFLIMTPVAVQFCRTAFERRLRILFPLEVRREFAHAKRGTVIAFTALAA